jgi:hypothetical protein
MTATKSSLKLYALAPFSDPPMDRADVRPVACDRFNDPRDAGYLLQFVLILNALNWHKKTSFVSAVLPMQTRLKSPSS